MVRAYGWTPAIAADLTAGQFWSRVPAEQVWEPEVMSDEAQADLVETVKRLSARHPERGGSFDWATEVVPEWRKVEQERVNKAAGIGG